MGGKISGKVRNVKITKGSGSVTVPRIPQVLNLPHCLCYMARQTDRNWNKGRIHIWSRDSDRKSPASRPPPPPPPPPSGFSSRTSSAPPSYPPPPPPPPPAPPPVPPPQSDWNDPRSRQWEPDCVPGHRDQSRSDQWVRNEETAGRTVEGRPSDRRKPMASLLRFSGRQDSRDQRAKEREAEDGRGGSRPPRSPYHSSPPERRKEENRVKKFLTQVREEIRERIPPPPPRLDFPVNCRVPNPEYRRVDQYDEDSRLRAELYPLEDEPARKEVQGSYRRGPETIDILPERNKKDRHENELVPKQRVKDPTDRSCYYDGYRDTADPKPGTSNQMSNLEEYNYSGSRPFRGDPQDFSDVSMLEREDSLQYMYNKRNYSEVPCDGRYKSRDAASDDMLESDEEGFDWRASPPPDARRQAYDLENVGSKSGGVYEMSDRRNSLFDRDREFRREPMQRSVQILDPRPSPERRVMEEDRICDPGRGYTNMDRRFTRGGSDVRGQDVYDRRGYERRDVYERARTTCDRPPAGGRNPAADDENHRLKDYRERYLLTYDPYDAVCSTDLRSNAMGDYWMDDKRNVRLNDYRDRRDQPLEDSRESKTERRGGSREDTTNKIPPRNDKDKSEKKKDSGDVSDNRKYEVQECAKRTEKQSAVAKSSAVDSSLDRNYQPADRRSSKCGGYDKRSDVKVSADERSGCSESKLQDGCESDKDGKWSGSSQQSKTSRCPLTDTLRKRSGGELSKVGRSPPYEILKEEISDIQVEKRDSVLLPVLEDSEKEFHELVAAGNVAAVRKFLVEHPGFNINCVNYQKISALHVAVHEQNEAMVEFLLEQKTLDCSDCALYAIKEGNIRIVEKIMDKIRETSPGLEYAATTHSVDFPDDMTPIILAAQLGNYEIIDFLIKREHIIPPVHNPYCKCDACKADLQHYDRLKYSTMKLNLYKAICNPMYIFHVTDDPFQRAFDLTQELQDAAKVFPQFKSSYEELWRELRNFTVDLIGCCRNAQEVEIILKKSANNIAGSITFPRLQYAIDLKQKEFVSHPYTQAVLVDAWTGDLLEWKVRSPLMQALSVFPRIPMLPIMAVMCMFLPNHRLVKKWKTPVNKMISSVASYLIFLIILFMESNLDKRNQKRGPPNSGLEGLIIIYVAGYIWLNVRLCFRLGPKRFFSTMWHWFDCIMLFLFTMTIIFWVASLADITANNEIDLPRKYWNSLDPELIAEGFFAAAVIMAFFRLNMFLSLNYHLGPLQVSIGKMTLDIFRFIIIFFIIIIAWCAGLCRFYQPYDGMVQKDAASGSSTTQVSSFVSFSMTLKTFFWAIFGMSPIESADVVIENLPGDTPDTTIINHHEFTEAVGYTAFALFQFLSVVVVLNMLVACMANTFTKVIDNVTVEWVFGRSQIYLSFMAASTLPPPFNLLPTAAGIKSTLVWLKLLVKPSNGQRAKCNISHCCYLESETEAYVNSEFPSLMSELAQRYLRVKGECVESHDDLEELKCEMKELLRKMDKMSAMRKGS